MDTKYTQQAINKIYKKRDKIDLSPDFQREKVWKKARKQYFIDTLLKGWGIPKIFLLSTDDKTEDKKNYACIDGKQRLLAILEFISNDYPTGIKFDSVLGEKLYSELPEALSDKFDDYLLPIEEVTNASADEISELFKRLQLGVPLNSGENLMAVSGYMKDQIKGFSDHNFFKNKVSIQNTRYSHFVVCTQIAFLEINGITNLSLNKLEDFLKQNKDKTKIGYNIETKLKKIKLVLDYLDKVFSTKSDVLKNRATIVSFYLFISMFIDTANIENKETKFKTFFEKFSRELNKQIILGTEATDTKFIHYQNSVIQGADKQKAIKNRQDVLAQKLLEYSKDLYKLLNPQTSLEDKFSDMFDKIEKKHKKQEAINNWVISQNAKVPYATNCNAHSNLTQKETLPVHIRNCIHHKTHGTFTSAQVEKSIKVLEPMIKNL